MSAAVRYEAEGPIAVITLNRPAELNAVNLEVCDAVFAALKKIESDPQRFRRKVPARHRGGRVDDIRFLDRVGCRGPEVVVPEASEVAAGPRKVGRMDSDAGSNDAQLAGVCRCTETDFDLLSPYVGER
jgi:hypothetical protein